MQLYLALIINGIFMLSLLSIYSLYKNKLDNTKNKIINGLILGVLVILIMYNQSLTLNSDAIYDSRNIVLSLSGTFFGPLSTFITLTVSIVYRIILSKSGVILAITEMILASLIGLLWVYVSKYFSNKYKWIKYFLLGFITHTISLMIIYFIPSDINNITKSLLIPYLIIYPIFTSIGSFVLKRRDNIEELKNDNLEQKRILDATINSTKTMEIYALDKNYNYITYNDYHNKMMEVYYLRKIKEGKNFFDLVENKKMKERLKKSYDKALKGIYHKEISEIEVTPNKFVEETFSPIYNSLNEVIGVTVFSVEISDMIRQQNELKYISYHDSLTGLYNRRYFDEMVDKYFKEKRDVSLIFFDINGLKVINDSFGHLEGDRLIIEISKKLKKHQPKNSHLFRIGGDEFILLIENDNWLESINLANKIKENVSKLKIRNINLSVSYGVSTTKDRTIYEAISDSENRMNRNKLIERTSHRGHNIKALLETLNIVSGFEKEHSKRVEYYVEVIADELNLSETMIGLLKTIAMLHDVGKIGISKELLNKPGKLTEQEFDEIKRHPIIGYRLLSAVPEYSEIAYDVLSHHERYDGLGYPNGLKGKDIPFRARVISVADAYDAMISKRPYKKPLSKKEAILELINNKGTQFDPEIVDAFINGLKKRDKDVRNIKI